MRRKNKKSTEWLPCEFRIKDRGFSSLLKVRFPSIHLSPMLSFGALHMHIGVCLAQWLGGQTWSECLAQLHGNSCMTLSKFWKFSLPLTVKWR